MENKGTLFIETLVDIHQRESYEIFHKYPALRSLLERICHDLTVGEHVQFSNLFSRIVFISHKHNFPKRKQWELQHFRIVSDNVRKAIIPEKEEYFASLKILAETIAFFYKLEIPEALQAVLPKDRELEASRREKGEHYAKLRVEVIDILTEENILHCRDQEAPTEEGIRVRFGIPKLNEAYNPTIKALWTGAQLNLLDVKVDKEGVFQPRHFILEPDYLLDASAVAESTKPSRGADIWHPYFFLLSKFKPRPHTTAIHKGNIANFFLDELVNANGTAPSFNELFAKTFKEAPFEYVTLEELNSPEAFKNFQRECQVQYNNLRRVVENEFEGHDSLVEKEHATLEPSFISETYGLQGRLDLFEASGDKFNIVELKSGKLPFPSTNASKVNTNHKAQATIYRLLIQSVFGKKHDEVFPYICYSTAQTTGTNLRYVAPVASLDQEILNLRNRIVALEHHIADDDGDKTKRILEGISPEKLNVAEAQMLDFVSSDFILFQDVLAQATALEKAYFFAFTAFVAKEQQLAKVGDGNYSRGQSNLWNRNDRAEEQAFELLDSLAILDNQADCEGMCITLKRPQEEKFVNFRQGDIVVLYPKTTKEDSVLQHQVIKGSIEQIGRDAVTIRLRYRQRNTHYFERHQEWCLEPDMMEIGFADMYRSLFALLREKPEKKAIILGLKEPRQNPPVIFDGIGEADNINAESRKEQNRLISNILSAKDYFLLVGPPGAGKTSFILKNLTKELHKDTSKNILLLAFTNRAVDEICEAIGEHPFIRVGSELSTAKPFRPRLLKTVIGACKNRKEIRQTIDEHRIFVGTVASLSGKPELFRLKNFDVAIIDEASQVLEPQLVGILPKVKKFVLIGDHKQLPAVVIQDPVRSKIDDPLLKEIGLTDRRNSYFERMFELCKTKGWHHAIGTLTYQGRMHPELMAFPNQSFYEGILQPVGLPHQLEALGLEQFDAENAFEQLLANQRLAFLPSQRHPDDRSDKVNSYEAETISQLTQALIKLYGKNGKDFDPEKTLGIIAPYRNQLARIRQQLEADGIPNHDKITVDTVERFQGGQRDHIFISFCVNSPYQLENLVSGMAEENGQRIDRKLNVALTRAKKQLVCLGNKTILERDEVYRKLMEGFAEPTGETMR